MRVALVALALLLAVGCARKPSGPPAEEVRSAVAAYMDKFGETLEFEAGPGLRLQHMQKGYTVLAVPVRGALRLNKDIFWSEMKSITVQVEEYVVPALIKRREDFNEGSRQHLARGGTINGVTPIPAGATYVFDGKVLFRPQEKGFAFDEWVEKHRGWCADEAPAACYARHQVEDPIRR